MLEGNPYDGHTLSTTIDQVVAMTDVEPERDLRRSAGIAGMMMPRRIGCSSRASGEG